MIKRKCFNILLFLILSFFSNSISSQDVKFERLSVDKGLSHSSVFCIFQDSKGFMWFGTQNGLNKFDGYDFTVFKNIPGDSTSISHNTIFSIFEDSQNNIWIGTLGGGLNKYDAKHDRFIHYLHTTNSNNSISNNNVRSIFEDRDGMLWIGTDNGLNLFDQSTKTFKRFINDLADSNSISNNSIWSIYQDSCGSIWIGTYNGLNKIEHRNNEIIFKKYINNSRDKNSLSHNYVWSICEDKNKNLWIGTDDGLNRFNAKTNNFNRYFSDNGLSHNKIWSLYLDKKNDFWIGTLGGGLNKLENYDNGKIQFSNYKNDIYNNQSLSHNFVWSIYEDRSGVLWVSTEIGLNKYDETRFKFNLIKNIPGNFNSLSSNEVTAIFIDSFGIKWIGTRNGLNKYDPLDNKYIHYNTANTKNKISDNYVRAIYEAPSDKGILWVGTNNGLNKINLISNSLTVYYNEYNKSTSINNNNITDIFEDSDQNLWIGSLGGLNKLDREKEIFDIFIHDPNNNSISNNYVFAIEEDLSGNLWIATGLGLNKYNKRTNLFENFFTNNKDTNSLSNNFISDIYVDEDNNLWICTNGGLNKLDISNNIFTRFRETNGLPNNAVVGIEQDDSGYLWISTNSGISKLDPRNKVFQNYSIGDGLQSTQFTGGASYKSKEGELFFGGINGLNSFYPEQVNSNSKIPPIVITKFLIYNEEVPIGNDSPLEESIDYTSNIDLSYTENNFSFSFAALHYSYPSENRYKYKLQGFDRDWVESGNQRFANYTNIDPGEYVFTVTGSNNDGVWNEAGTSIKINIKPPFWETWWFILLFTSALFYLIISFFQYRTKNLLALERLRLKIAEDLHDDIGTRLTEISMLSDIVYHSQKQNPESKTIKKIGTIARVLIDSMSEIVWLINPKRDSLYELFLKLKDTYEDLLSSSSINFQINDFKFLAGIKLPIEVRKNIYLLFKEAINNSIKHSGCSEISINSQIRNRQLSVTLYDNGKGFNLTDKTLGNGIHNMRHRAEMINGELKINSTLGSGTIIEYKGKV